MNGDDKMRGKEAGVSELGGLGGLGRAWRLGGLEWLGTKYPNTLTH